MEAPRSLPGSRRHHGARRLARGLCLGALTLALSGLAAAPAGAVAGPGVEIVGPGFSGVIEPAEMEWGAEGVVKGTCGLRGRAGEVPQQNGCYGLPVATALSRVEAGSFGYLTLPRTNGTTAYLSATETEEPTSAFEGDMPPIFFVDKPATRFYRPPKKGDANDVNAEDNIATVSGEALVVGVHEGRVVEVQVTPSPTTTSAGNPVQFTATASGGESGETFTYDWTFGDGTTAESVGSESVSHAFAGSGTYQVRATAVGSEESGGESGPVEVVVGNPPTTEAPGATTTPPATTKKPTGAPGKGREGQGGKGSKPAPSGRRKSKKGRKSKGDSRVRRGDSPTVRSHSREPSEPSVPPVATPAEAPLPEPFPLPEEPSSAAPESEAPAKSAAPTERTPPQPPSASQGELVEGRLVGDDLGPTALEEAVGGGAEGQGSRSAPGAVVGGGIGVPVGALIVVALLAGGALFEWRRGRPIR